MPRLTISREKTRIALTLEDGRKVLILTPEALILADASRRLADQEGRSDVEVGGVRIHRQGSEIHLEFALRKETAQVAISSIDAAALADMIQAASQLRGFNGSIGLLPTQDEEITANEANLETSDPVAPAPASTDIPAMRHGRTLLDLELHGKAAYRRQRDFTVPQGWRDRNHPKLHTFEWQTPRHDLLAVVDRLPRPVYMALRAFWQGFEKRQWNAAEWTQSYSGDDIWRMTSRDLPPTQRLVISGEIMETLERHGLVTADDLGLRVSTQASYDLWRAASMAGIGSQDEVLSRPVPVPMGFFTPQIDRLDNLDTCIVEFTPAGPQVHPLRIDETSWGSRFVAQLDSIGVRDDKSAEVARRIGDWIYPERDCVYARNLRGRIARQSESHYRHTSAGTHPGWDSHFRELTTMGEWHQHALGRYRRGHEGLLLPAKMPPRHRPENWWHDPLLGEGREKRRKQIEGRARNKGAVL